MSDEKDPKAPPPHSWMQNSGKLPKENQPPPVEPPVWPSEPQQVSPHQQQPAPPYQPPPPYRQPTPRPYQPPGFADAPTQPLAPLQRANFVNPHPPDDSLASASMIISVIVSCFMIVGLVPCLGWLNWFTLSVGGVNLIISIIALLNAKTDKSRNMATIGLVVTGLACAIGFVRLLLGACIF